MAILLLGTANAYNSSVSGANYFRASIFTAGASGLMTEFLIECHGNTNIKCAIYSDNAGTPNTRLWVDNVGVACVAGWNTIAVTGGPTIVKDAVYWLASNNSVANTIRYINSTGTMKYKVADYAAVGCPTDMTGLSSVGYELMHKAQGVVGGRNNVMLF